ncbi:MAG: AzlD domain-containing protein [Neofamilia sp.]
MSENLYLILAIIIVSLCTYFTRGIPYLLFKGKDIPPLVTYLSVVLPLSIMIILVVFSIRNISLIKYPYGAPKLISIAIVAALQYFKKNLLLSIILGTLCYMALVGFIF